MSLRFENNVLLLKKKSKNFGSIIHGYLKKEKKTGKEEIRRRERLHK